MNKLRFVIVSYLCISFSVFTYSKETTVESLFWEGMELYNANNYKGASKLFEKCLRFDEKECTKKKALILIHLADCYVKLGNYLTAVEKSVHALKIWKIVEENNDEDNEIHNIILKLLQASLDANGLNRIKQENYEAAVNNYELALAYHGELYGRVIAGVNCKKTEIDETTEEGYNLANKYAWCLEKVAEKHYNQGNYVEAAKLYKHSFESWKGYYNKNNTEHVEFFNRLVVKYILQLVCQSDEFFKSKEYVRSVDLLNEAMNVGKRYVKSVTVENVNIFQYVAYKSYESLRFLAMEYSDKGEYDLAMKAWKRALDVNSEYTNNHSVEYADWLYKLSLSLQFSDRYNEAYFFSWRALKLYGEILGKDNVHYAKALDNLGVIELIFEDYDEAESHARQAMEIRKEILGDNHSDYLISLVSMTAILRLKGNYIEARDICEEGLKKTETTNKKQHITFLEFYSDIQSQLGYDTEAECALEKALAMVDKSDTLGYSSLLTALAGRTYSKGEYEKALELYEQVISLDKATKGVESLLYASTLNNICDVLIKLGKFKEADTYLYKAFEVADKKEVSGRSFASFLGTLANLQFALGNFENGIDAAKTALGIRMEQGNAARQDIIMNIENLTDIIYGYGRQNELSYFSYRATSSLNDEILEKFKDMTTVERKRFWGKYSSWYMEKLSKYAYCFPTDTLCMTAYNGALMSKGLLLNSEIEMKKLLQKSGDEMALSIYEELRMNKVMLQRLYEKPKKERNLSTDSIEKIVDILEKQLLKRSKVYGDYTKNLRIDYKDVRGKLKDGDLAVEFCSFPLSKDSTMYMALVLRNDMEYPKMIPLFEEKQISKTSPLLEEMQIGTLRRDIYMGGHTATLVWKPLEQYLNKAKNVYFSPSGELYNIAIENIPHWSENCLMSDKWNIYRLSSTRELAAIRDKEAVRKATVYGGIVYDTGTDVLTADTLRYGRQRSVFYGLYNLSDSLSVRGGVEYLPATKEEAEYVDDALKGRHIASTLRTDMQATEGAFKDMAGKRNNLLHIATHAFYWPEKEVATADRDFMFMSNMPQRYKEDKAMTRSGLVLAGANNALRGMKLPEDVNDGILTAKEIAQLDLRVLVLVVLSACQTGLGEVTGDGVFGLQRGFKKAGANSLMMSLWSVEDKATSLFMKEFYRQLMAGNGKHESMKAAQRHVREYKETDEDGEMIHPYDNYKYWAAFVLLDAIH